ncbi:hypothetical protein AAFF_G00222340 [Aldrovandia affinis]|uniref:Uncharacterized protein n=1 Tax=Aldrovandia affinis TaxID=143900 RepID=A0AAD7RFS7_9TELE|nr:hypothetical protein AAFF_G00222340 [Aldrovandia affinis]
MSSLRHKNLKGRQTGENRPLLLDVVPAIQQTAALAMGKLANYSQKTVKGDILLQLVHSLVEQNIVF